MIVRCAMCKKEYDIPITDGQLRRWRDGAFIQDAAPELRPDQRELLISQTCGECFDKLFPPEDEE